MAPPIGEAAPSFNQAPTSPVGHAAALVGQVAALFGEATAPPGQAVPLLPAQRFKWAAYQRDPEAPNLVIPIRLRIRGKLDRAALAWSLQAVQDAQPALRATFHQGPDGEPVQYVHAGVPIEFATADVSSEGEPEDAAAGLAARMAGRPFLWDQPGGLRAQLIRVGVGNHLLVLCFPGIAVDGWSGGIILDALETNYRRAVSGQPIGAADRADHTVEYLWCCEAANQAADPDGPRAASYARWLDEAPRLVLPTDRPYPSRRAAAGAEVQAELTAEEVAVASATARERRTSLSALLFTAYCVLLSRWSGQHRFATGAFVSGRTRPRSVPLVGRFAHLVAMPIDLDGCDTPAATIDRVSRVWWHSHDYHDTPLAALASRPGLRPPAGRLPVADVAFVHQFGEPSLAVGDEVSIRREREPTAISPQDLSLFIIPADADALSVRLEYRTDLFDAATARAALERYLAILAELSGARPAPPAPPGAAGAIVADQSPQSRQSRQKHQTPDTPDRKGNADG